MRELDLEPKTTNVDVLKKQLIAKNQAKAIEEQQALKKDEVEVSISEADKLRREGYTPLASYVKGGLKVYKLKKPETKK